MTLAHNDRFPTNVCRNNQNKHLRGDVAKARMHAWLSILEAVAEQRDGLQHRIWREDPEDKSLEADCRNLCALIGALGDFLQARRTA